MTTDTSLTTDHTDALAADDDTATDALSRARALELPDREAMLRRDPSVQRFWNQHRDLLIDAWVAWDADRSPVALDATLLDDDLRSAVVNAWADPTTEAAVLDLLREAAPGVYSVQFFDPERIHVLRDYLADAWDAGIPLRPPYGILLNRGGAMLDPRSEGHLAAPTYQRFQQMVNETYLRPIARLLFPEIMGFDTQAFGFSINYQPTTDTSIRPHTDASSVTLNINANLPGENFTGSSVDFLDQESGAVTSLTFEPGTAIIHRGNVPHTAQPITSGERTNLVLWLYGQGGSIPLFGEQPDHTPDERWSVPAVASDGHAPF